MALTGKNEIVGTLYYMSPEQLQAQGTGQEVDARSDIFSFGLVLYEMLTGKRAFDGASPATVIAAIMERPAPSIADVAPPALDRVLKRCLEKDPENRWQSARDLKAELEWIAQAPSDGSTAAASTARPTWLPWVAAGVLALVAAAASSWVAYRSTRPAELKALGTPGCGFRSRRVFDRGRRVRRNNLSRWRAHCLPLSRPYLHAPTGSSERHRAPHHPRRDQPVFLPRRPVDRLYGERKDEKSLGRGRLRGCLVRRGVLVHRRRLG